MEQKLSRLGLLLSGSYLALVLLATALIAYARLVHPGNSELVGMPLILFTQPWSQLLFRLLEIVHFNHRLWPVSAALLLSCAGLNAFILYQIGALLSRNVFKSNRISKGGLFLAVVYSALILWAAIDLGRAVYAKTAPGISVWVLTITSQPWQIPVSMLLRVIYNFTKWIWLTFIPVPFGIIVNGFVVYALGASLFRQKVSAPNSTNV